MNPPRATDQDYIDFLIGTPRAASACEAARVQPPDPDAPAPRRLHPIARPTRTRPRSPVARGPTPHVRRTDSILVVEDTVLDKPYAHKVGLVGPFWSGKHQRVLRGINLVTLAGTDGDAVYPTDDRLVDPAEAPKRNKNEHFREVLVTAKARGFAPRYVCFDAWYSSKENLTAVRGHGWHFLTQVRSNRRVDPDRTGNRSISDRAIAATGTVVHVEGFGFVKAFRLVAPNGDTEHWITNDLSMDDLTRLTYAQRAWAIEEYHRGLKQCTEVERCPARLARSQRNHIGLALRAFVRFEWHRFTTGVRWFEAKWDIIRDTVRAYLANPRYNLPDAATA